MYDVFYILMIFVGPPMMGPPPMMYAPPMRMHPGMNLNLDININQRPADFPVVTPSYVQGRCIFFYSFQNGCSFCKELFVNVADIQSN